MKKVFVLVVAISLVIGFSITGYAMGRSERGEQQRQQQAQQGQQSQQGQQAQQGKQVSDQDRQFVQKAAQSGMLEVQAGQLAQEKATDDSVKQFGQTMVNEHKKVNDQLKQMSQSMNIEIPQQMSSEHKAKLDKLSGLSGAEFDRVYMDTMVQEHRSDIQLFQRQAEQGENSQLKSFAERRVSNLQQHLAKAQDLSKQQQTAQR